jgi:hypothetical protein
MPIFDSKRLQGAKSILSSGTQHRSAPANIKIRYYRTLSSEMMLQSSAKFVSEVVLPRNPNDGFLLQLATTCDRRLSEGMI